jgi:hypothetical protein
VSVEIKEFIKKLLPVRYGPAIDNIEIGAGKVDRYCNAST